MLVLFVDYNFLFYAHHFRRFVWCFFCNMQYIFSLHIFSSIDAMLRYDLRHFTDSHFFLPRMGGEILKKRENEKLNSYTRICRIISILSSRAWKIDMNFFFSHLFINSFFSRSSSILTCRNIWVFFFCSAIAFVKALREKKNGCPLWIM